MKESVDKCTKKIEIQSQKLQYEIAHMYNSYKEMIKLSSVGVRPSVCV